MARVNMISSQGEQVNIDAQEVEAAKALGYKLPGEVMAMGHRPGQEIPVKPTEDQGAMWAIIRAMSGMEGGLVDPNREQSQRTGAGDLAALRPGPGEAAIWGAAGNLGPLAAAAGGSAGGLTAPPNMNFREDTKAAIARAQEARSENPTSAFAGSFLSPESMGMGAAGGALAGAARRGILRAAPETVEEFGPGAALRAMRPGLKDVTPMWMGSHLGGMLGSHEAGALMGGIPYAARVASDPAVQFQATKMITPLSRLLGAGVGSAGIGANGPPLNPNAGFIENEMMRR